MLFNRTHRFLKSSACSLPRMTTLLVVTLSGVGCTLGTHSERSSRAVPIQNPPPMETPADPTEPVLVQAAAKPTTTAAAVAANDRPRVREENPSRIALPPALSPEVEAIEILQAAGRTDWPLLRANALEAISYDREALQTMVMASLNDENRGVRFVAAMLVGREKLCDVRPLIEKMLEDPSDSVRAAAIYALSACDGAVNPTPLAEMVSSSSPEVRGNAYVVLGLLGEASAIPLIRSGLGQGLGLVDPVRVRLVDLQGAAALVRLGDEREIEPIRAALFAPTEQSELTALAIQLVSQLHDEGARQMLVRLVEAPMRESRPPEIRLAAAEAIAVLGALEAAPMIRLANEYIENPRSEIRAQVASLLGEVNDATARALLSDLMKDPDPIVRVAAAGSTLKLGVDERTATASVH
jgi:hypothetical protein